MRSVTWETDDGYTIRMAGEPPYLFKQLDDDLGASAETVKAPRQDGCTTYHVSLGTRTINVAGSLVAYGGNAWSAQAAFDRRREALSQAFSPNRWGYLTYHREDGDRRVRCRPLATPTFGERAHNTCTLEVELVTDSPYWESAELYTYTAGISVPLLHFPSRLPKAFGSLTPRAVIQNPTGEVIYPTIEIAATASRVKVANETTGKYIQVNRPIAAGQMMVVAARDMSAELWTPGADGAFRRTEDASCWLALDSEPWGMVPGVNVIAVTNEHPEDMPLTRVKYRLPYLGV